MGIQRLPILCFAGLCCLACSDNPPAGPSSAAATIHPDIAGIAANDADSLSTIVTFVAADADSSRAIGISLDGEDTVYSLTRRRQEGRLSLLGLRPRTAYKVVVEAWKGTERQVSPEHIFATGALPGPISNAHLALLNGVFGASGYILVPMTTPESSYLVIFDNGGRLVWYRDFGQVPIVEAKQQPNGNFTVFLGATRGWDKVPGEFQEVDRLGNLVRTWKAPDGYYTDSHEIRIRTENAQAVAYFFVYNFHSADGLPGFNLGDEIAGHQLVRMVSTGEWSIVHDAWNEFSLDEMFEPPQPSGDFDHPNSLGFDRDDNLIISYRVLGTVVKVDRNTGKIIWRLGGLKSDFTFLNDPEHGFSAQHDAQILANGDILLFDNGWRHNPQQTRAVEYRLDENAKTATLVWSYDHDPETFAPYTGSVQRLSDGRTFVGFPNLNTVVAIGPNGKAFGEYRPMIDDAKSSGFYRAVVIRSLLRYEPM
jgi:Arylsulfotransferase (ASST).